MNALRKTWLALTLGPALVVGAGCATSSPAPPDIAALIGAAPSSADHQVIADYYQRKAETLNVEVKEHQKMRQAYGGSSKGQVNAMSSHCDSFIYNLQRAAADARNLAKLHQELAK